MNKQNNQKPCIAFLVPGLGNMGGSVRVAVNIANRLVKTGYGVAMMSCTPFDKVAFPLDSRVSTYAVDLAEGRIRERVTRAKEALTPLLAEIKPAVLMGIGAYETLFAIQPCRKLGVKLVFCDHGALINQWDDKQLRIMRLINSMFSAKTVVLTQQSLQDYRRMLHRPARKLVCIPNWIPAEMRTKPRAYKAQAKKLLWAGRLDKEKGVDHLLEIAALALPAHPDWTWDVYGAEVDTASGLDIRAEIEAAGIQEQFRLMGRVDNMYDLYDEYSVCTLTSYREGLPLTLLEGKARALPLISFDVNTGPRDIITDGEDGFLIPCYDCAAYAEKLGELMDSQELRERFSAHADATVDTFSEDAVFQQWITLLKELGA